MIVFHQQAWISSRLLQLVKENLYKPSTTVSTFNKKHTVVRISIYSRTQF